MKRKPKRKARVTRVPSAERHAALRIEIRTVIERTGTPVSLRALEVEIKAHRSTIAIVVADMFAAGELVKCPGHPKAPAVPTWDLALVPVAIEAIAKMAEATSGDASGDSGDAAVQVSRDVSTLPVVNEPESEAVLTRDELIAVFRDQARALGVPEKTIAEQCAVLAARDDRRRRHVAMLLAILEAADLEHDEGLAVYDAVTAALSEIPEPSEAVYLATISRVLVERGHTMTFAAFYDEGIN